MFCYLSCLAWTLHAHVAGTGRTNTATGFSGMKVEQHQDKGNRQQEMDEPSHREMARQTEQPERGQYQRNPTNCSPRNGTRESGPAPASGDGWRKRYNGFVKEERDPFCGVGVVSNRPAAEFISAVAVPDELSVAERGDDADFAGAAEEAVEIGFHSHPSACVVFRPSHEKLTASYAGRRH